MWTVLGSQICRDTCRLIRRTTTIGGQPHNLSVRWPWTSHLNFSGLSSLTCKRGMIAHKLPGFRAQNQAVVLRTWKHSFCPQWIWRWVGKMVEREVRRCGPNSPALIAWDHLSWHHVTWATETNLGLTIGCMGPNPRIEPRSPTLQADSSPAEPQGKPKNTGVGSLSLLQRIFPTQE